MPGPYAQRALDMAAELGLPAPPRAMNLRGRARLAESDLGGLRDCEAAIEAAEAAGDWDQAAMFMANYAADAGIHQGLARGLALTHRGIEMCDAHGLRSVGLLLRTSLAGILVDTGRLDGAVELIEGIVDETDESGDIVSTAYLLGLRSQVALVRGDIATAAGVLPRMLSIAADHPAQDDLHPIRIQAAAVLQAIGDEREGIRVLRSVIEDPVRSPKSPTSTSRRPPVSRSHSATSSWRMPRWPEWSAPTRSSRSTCGLRTRRSTRPGATSTARERSTSQSPGSGCPSTPRSRLPWRRLARRAASRRPATSTARRRPLEPLGHDSQRWAPSRPSMRSLRWRPSSRVGRSPGRRGLRECPDSAANPGGAGSGG